MLNYNHKILGTALIAVACLILPAHVSAEDQPPEQKQEELQKAAKELSVVGLSAKEAAGKGFTGDYLAALYARSTGDVPSAIRYLRKALRAQPANVTLNGQLQGLLLMDGQVEEAIDIAQKIHTPENKDAVTNLLLALRAIKSNNITQADSILQNVFEDGSGQLWQPLISAWLHAGQKKLANPFKLEDLGASAGRAALLANYHLGLINNYAGFKDEAALAFKDAIEDAENPPSHVMEALLAFYERQNHPEALNEIVAVYRLANPDSKLDDKKPLPSTVQEGVAEVLFTMGSIMQEVEVSQDAAVYLRLALYLRPDFDAARLTLGDAYNNLRQFQRSNETYAKIKNTSRLYSTAQLRIAMNYDRMEKPAEALAQLDKMLKQPGGFEIYVAKGDMLRLRNKLAEAVEAYSQSIARIKDPSARHWPIFFARGACYERLGKWQLAEQDLKKALELKPNQPEVLNYLGYSLLVRGEHIDDAREMLEKAIKARPNDGQILDSMGWALYLHGEYDEAAGYLEKAATLLPSDPTVNHHLGDLYWRMGRKTEARFQWERSLIFSPQEAEAEIIKKKIKEGLPPSTLSDNKKAKPAVAPIVASQQETITVTTP